MIAHACSPALGRLSTLMSAWALESEDLSQKNEIFFFVIPKKENKQNLLEFNHELFIKHVQVHMFVCVTQDLKQTYDVVSCMFS